MDLFNDAFDAQLNLLPCDGEVYYYGQIIDGAAADAYFKTLLETTPWQHDQVRIAGQTIITSRRVAWYGDNAASYTYSGTTKHALPWSHVLLELKQHIEHLSGHTFNSCLLNLYDNGEQGVSWHSDDEIMLDDTIASLSLGAQRKFAFKHKKRNEKMSLELAHGSLLIMTGATQQHWQHSLPKNSSIHQPRINLTFRTIKPAR